MSLFRKKPDPISDRARALNSEIEALQAQIRQYELKLHEAPPAPQRAASPAARNGNPSPFSHPDGAIAMRELALEDVDQRRFTRGDPEEDAPVNDFGVRKYNLPGVLKKVRQHLRPASTTNPRLVSYLAAGGIQGLRPLRYERRIARNRFLLLFGIFFLVLLGILSVFLRQQ
jgi:hypothetical protein